MGKNYLTQKMLSYLLLIGAMLLSVANTSAQSISCHGGLNASLDGSCRLVIDASDILLSTPPGFDPLNYELTVEARPGSDLSNVHYMSGGSLLKGHQGSLIVFTAPGSFSISVKMRGTNKPCWGNFTVEDKLPPQLIDNTCDCPEDVEFVSEECTFSCASIDEIYNKSNQVVQYDSIYQCLEQEKRATGKKIRSKVPTASGDSIWTYFDVYDWVCVRDTTYRVISGTQSCSTLPEAKKVNASLRPVRSLSVAPKCVTKAIKVKHNPTDTLNPQFTDNCGNVDDVYHKDEITETETCGEWHLVRKWYTKEYTEHGIQERQIACTQKFLFKKISKNDVRPPKAKVTVECGTETTPEALRKYFSNNPNTTHDSIPVCMSSPYVIDSLANSKKVYYPIGIETGSTKKHCKVLSKYYDTERIYPNEACASHYKFIRTWKLVDWCTGTTAEYNQLIVHKDSEAPKFALSDTMIMSSTDPWKCQSDHPVPAPINLMDNCTDASNIVWRAIVSHNSQRIVANKANGYRLRGLRPGSYIVRYEVEDGCGNMDMKTATLLLKDGVSPNVITKNVINVTFTEFEGDCTAKIYPHNIDLGTFDACDYNIERHIRRLGDSVWADHVKFDQFDLTSVSEKGIPYGEIKIEFRARDTSGNTSVGWSTARLEDKNSKVITQCGKSVINLICEEDFAAAVTDPQYAPYVIMRSCTDNRLNLDHVILKNDISESCNVGHARVAYFLPDTRDTLCIKDFYLTSRDTISIQWPEEEVIVGCAATSFGAPVVTGGECNSLAITYEDQVFDKNTGLGYCKKIIRRHTVIDWCLYKSNESDKTGIYKFTQVIKVKDDTKPVVICSDQEFTAGNGCGLSDIVVSATATDAASCDEELTWTASVDTDGNGTFDYPISPSKRDSGAVVATIDKFLNSGQYSIRWTATDGCGNTTVQVCQITIKDTKAPTPQCLGSLSTALMNTNGVVAIWAKDFDLDGKSVDECGSAISYSFSPTDINETSLTLTCDDIENGISDTVALRVYVWDEHGNNDFCMVRVLVSDNFDVCTDVEEGAALIAGSIATAEGNSIEAAEVMVHDKIQSKETMKMTNAKGNFAFGSNPLYHDYEVSASKKDAAANGVSTLDLVLIRQHILSMSLLDSPYKVIAADVSGDQRLSAKDLVEIRRVILGLQDQFSAGDAWTFVSSGTKFDDALAPWPYNAMTYINDVANNQRNVDFVAIKLGDVNGNAIANSKMAETRSISQAELLLTDVSMQTGVESDINLTIPVSEIAGMQLALKYDRVSVSDIRVYGLPLHEKYHRITDEHIVLSLDEVQSSGDQLSITIRATALADIYASEVISVDHERLRSEVYHGSDHYITSTLYLSVVDEQKGVFSLLQNKPNPFSDKTEIGYNLAESGRVELSIFNMAGELLMQRVEHGKVGYNKLSIDMSSLPETGVMYYQLSAGDQIATKKMIRL